MVGGRRRFGGGEEKLLFLTLEGTGGVEDFGTVGRIFVHDARVAEFLDEGFFPLNIGVRNITNLVGMETIPTHLGGRRSVGRGGRPFCSDTGVGKGDDRSWIDEIDECISHTLNTSILPYRGGGRR